MSIKTLLESGTTGFQGAFVYVVLLNGWTYSPFISSKFFWMSASVSS